MAIAHIKPILADASSIYSSLGIPAWGQFVWESENRKRAARLPTIVQGSGGWKREESHKLTSSDRGPKESA
jgi:hypothetical protein